MVRSAAARIPYTDVVEPGLVTLNDNMRSVLARCSRDTQRLGVLVLLLADRMPTDRDLMFLLDLDEGALAVARAEIKQRIADWNAGG